MSSREAQVACAMRLHSHRETHAATTKRVSCPTMPETELSNRKRVLFLHPNFPAQFKHSRRSSSGLRTRCSLPLPDPLQPHHSRGHPVNPQRSLQSRATSRTRRRPTPAKHDTFRAVQTRFRKVKGVGMATGRCDQPFRMGLRALHP